MNRRHSKVIDLLCRVAEDMQPVANARVAAALMHKGNVVSIGVNQYKTHPLQKKFSANPDSLYLHAEIHAISNALKRYDAYELSKMTLYISRIKRGMREGPFVCGLARPCDGCSSAIKAFGINKVFYTNDESGIEAYEL